MFDRGYIAKYGHGSTAPYKKERQRCNSLVCDRVKQVLVPRLVLAGSKRLYRGRPDDLLTNLIID